jgi:hypothetical protein
MSDCRCCTSALEADLKDCLARRPSGRTALRYRAVLSREPTEYGVFTCILSAMQRSQQPVVKIMKFTSRFVPKSTAYNACKTLVFLSQSCGYWTHRRFGQRMLRNVVMKRMLSVGQRGCWRFQVVPATFTTSSAVPAFRKGPPSKTAHEARLIIYQQLSISRSRRLSKSISNQFL